MRVRLLLIVDLPHVLVEADVAAIRATLFLDTNDDALDDIALLDLSARDPSLTVATKTSPIEA